MSGYVLPRHCVGNCHHRNYWGSSYRLKCIRIECPIVVCWGNLVVVMFHNMWSSLGKKVEFCSHCSDNDISSCHCCWCHQWSQHLAVVHIVIVQLYVILVLFPLLLWMDIIVTRRCSHDSLPLPEQCEWVCIHVCNGGKMAPQWKVGVHIGGSDKEINWKSNCCWIMSDLQGEGHQGHPSRTQ